MRACLRSLVAALQLGLAVAGAWAQSSLEEHEEAHAPLNRPVESRDLPPVLLPLDLWRGLDASAIEKWLASPDVPPRSPALHQLWRRMLLSSATPPAGRQAGDDLRLRAEAFYRAGLLSEIGDLLGTDGAPDPAVQIWRARVDIGLGRREKACQALAGPGDPQASRQLKADKQLLLGYCAAVAGDTRAAALAASLAREEGSTDELALSVLGSLDGGVAGRPALPARVSLLAYRFLELMGPIDSTEVLHRAEPALLVALAGSSALDANVQVAAADLALGINALAPEAVAGVYRRLDPSARADARSNPVLRRAQLFLAVQAARAPELKARLVRSLLDEARRAGVHLPAAQMLVPQISGLWPSPATAPLAEAIVEVAVAGGEFDLARRWAESAANLQHWLALIDLADPQTRRVRQSGLLYLEDLAKRGRLAPAGLHRTVTVLDALDIDVPLRLWEAATRVAQPAHGHLPPTGVLAELAQASQQKEMGRTVLLVTRALGPDGPDGANVLALGDSLRALKRTGLDADARRLAVEALFAAWPRTSGN
jgi:hypothetical protein